jgi:hypothetical protein
MDTWSFSEIDLCLNAHSNLPSSLLRDRKKSGELQHCFGLDDEGNEAHIECLHCIEDYDHGVWSCQAMDTWSF